MIQLLRVALCLVLGGLAIAQEPAPKTDSVILAVVGPGMGASAAQLGGSLLPGESVVPDGSASQQERDLATSAAQALVTAFGDARKSAGREVDLLRVLPVRVMGSDGAASADKVAEGIRRAIERGARVLVVLVAGGRSSERLQAALKDAEAKGCLVFAGAGGGQEMFDLQPAAHPWVLSSTRVTSADCVEARVAAGTCASGKTELAVTGEGSAPALVTLRAAVMAAVLLARRGDLPAARMRELLRFHGPRAALDEHDWPFRMVTPAALDGIPAAPASFVEIAIEDAWVESAAARPDEPAKAIIKIRSLGTRAAGGTVECTVEGLDPVKVPFEPVAPGDSAAVVLTLPALPEGVHVVRVRAAAKDDVNPANDSWPFRVTCSSGNPDPIVRRVRVLGLCRESGKAVVAAEVFNPGPGKRTFDLAVRFSEASFSKPITMEPGVFTPVSLEIDIPDPKGQWREVPLLLFLNRDGRRVAFDGGLLRVDIDSFKP